MADEQQTAATEAATDQASTGTSASPRELELQAENARLKGLIPKTGAVTLSGADADAWERHRKLGDPSEVEKALSEGQLAIAKVKTYERHAFLDRAAAAAGFKAPVLRHVAGDLDIRLEQADGKERAVVKGPDGKLVSLEEYAKANWADFLPALKPGGAQAVGLPEGGSRYAGSSRSGGIPRFRANL